MIDLKDKIEIIFNEYHYGRVELVNLWKNPFRPGVESNEQEEYGEFILEHSNSFYSFQGELIKSKMFHNNMMCSLCEFLTMNEYVPNMFEDQVSLQPTTGILLDLRKYEMQIPFATLLTLQTREQVLEIVSDHLHHVISAEDELLDYMGQIVMKGAEFKIGISTDIIQLNVKASPNIERDVNYLDLLHFYQHYCKNNKFIVPSFCAQRYYQKSASEDVILIELSLESNNVVKLDKKVVRVKY